MYDLGRAMAQAVSRRPLTAAAWVRVQVNPVGFVVDMFFSEFFAFPLSTVGSTFPKIQKNNSFIHSSFIPSLILTRGRSLSQ
jgi:hypothetical protein